MLSHSLQGLGIPQLFTDANVISFLIHKFNLLHCSPRGEYYNMQNAGPTLAQLNSPPNNEDLTTLKNFGDLDSLNLDLEALTGDLLSGYPAEVKTEYVPVIQQSSFMSTPYSRGQSSLSTSVPTPVISHSDFHDLSNLSNGGPPVSPNRLTLSPPSRGGLSPQYRPALSPTLSTHLIPATVPTSPPQPSSLHELLSRGQQQNQVLEDFCKSIIS